jgi:CMP-N-acetylneuraminic acid synthetase
VSLEFVPAKRKTHLPIVYCLIPARGGSKSIQRKNIRSFRGRPLISYSITTALKSSLVNKVFVSTEDKLIADISRFYGAEVPYLRSKEYALDSTRDFHVITEFIHWLSNNNFPEPDLICFLRPTCPDRDPKLIDFAITELQRNSDFTGLRSMRLARETPFKMWEIDINGIANPIMRNQLNGDETNTPRQELPNVYWQDGYVDCLRPETISSQLSMLGNRVFPLIIDAPQVELDYEEDLSKENTTLFGNSYVKKISKQIYEGIRRPT